MRARVTKRKRPAGPSDLEVQFANLWAIAGDRSRRPVTEHPFAESIGRKWRIDFAWPDVKVGVEIEGGVYRPGGGTALGGHNSATGFQKDIEKYNSANDLGWRIYRFTGVDLRQRPTQVIEQVLAAIRTK